MARKLVTIQKIAAIEPHPNADRLEIATILGWKCVVGKGDFKVDDLCVYFEVDSFLPIRPEFEFLAKNTSIKKMEDGTEGYRLKTARLRGIISKGLVMPLTVLTVVTPWEVKTFKDIKEGADVTEHLGVQLWVPPIPADMKGLIKGDFPAFIAPTDETRVQAVPDVIKRCAGLRCYITEKIDGTSFTVYFRNGEFGVCSRSKELLEEEKNLYWKMTRELDLEKKLRDYGKNIAIQGEIFGIGVQTNALKLQTRRVMFFNVFDIDKFGYYPYADFVKTIKELGLETVPILTEDYILEDNVDKIMAMADGKSVISPKFDREGIVIRPHEEKFDMQMAMGFGNGRVSFKAVSDEWLIKND